jgi:hypothetical protein
MLWILIVVLVVLWLGAVLIAKVASGLIHLLLVVALIVLIVKLVKGRGVV